MNLIKLEAMPAAPWKKEKGKVKTILLMISVTLGEILQKLKKK